MLSMDVIIHSLSGVFALKITFSPFALSLSKGERLYLSRSWFDELTTNGNISSLMGDNIFIRRRFGLLIS